MKRQILTISFLVFGCGIFLLSCDDKTGPAKGSLPSGDGVPAKPAKPAKPAVPVKPTKPPTHVFANNFNIVNSGAYEKLLRICSRCGTKRLIRGPFGGTTYQRFWEFGEGLKTCQNWLGGGFLQLEFTQTALPTEVKVLFQPKYRGSVDVWGQPFELSSTARPINRDKGFEIVIAPNQGLLGTANLVINSTDSTPVKDTLLYINVSYDNKIMIDTSVQKYTERRVDPAQFNCQQFTN